MSRCRYVQDLPAIAARVQIDHTHAGYHRIEEILRRVMISALVREQVWRDGHANPASRQFTRTSFPLRYYAGFQIHCGYPSKHLMKNIFS